MPERDAEIQRLRMLPWSRVIVAKPGGGYQARVRELANCSADGATPAEALERVEVELDRILREGAGLPEPSFWDRSATEAFPVRLTRPDHEAAVAAADAAGLSLGGFAERSIGEAVRHAASPMSEARARIGRVVPKRARSISDMAFPEAHRSDDHWLRVVLDRAIAAHLESLDPPKRSAAEISGNTHARVPWQSYVSLDYPEFDLCAPLSQEGPFDVVICEQVLEHVDDPRVAAANLRALCRPGGHVVVSTPFLIRVHELEEYGMHDYWRFTPRGLAMLLEGAGLVVDEVGDWGNRACVYGNLRHWSSYRKWHSLRREPDIPVQVWAFARNPE